MESNFDYYISSRSDEELLSFIDNRQKYMPETIQASVAELKHRGHEFSDEELRMIFEDMQAHRHNAEAIDSRLGLFSNYYQNAIVEDPAAPLFYSRRVLYVFTVLFGALFGSVMLAMNLGKMEKKINALWVLLFGVGFSILQKYIIVLYAQLSSVSTYIVLGNFIAAYLLDIIFWKQYIGYATFYRARSFWGPLIIGLVLSGFVVFSIIYGEKA